MVLCGSKSQYDAGESVRTGGGKMKLRGALVVLLAALLVNGCSGMSSTEQRTLSGGAIGAAGGAVIGAIGGNAALGAGVGAGAGLLGGYLYDKYEQSKEDAYEKGRAAGREEAAH